MADSDSSSILPRSARPAYLKHGQFVIARGGLVGASRLHRLGEDAESRLALSAPERAAERAKRAAARRVLLAPPQAAGALGIPAEFVTTSPPANPLIAKRRRELAPDRIRVRFELQDTARELLPDYRVRHCNRTPAGSCVTLHYHAEHGSASYGGLQTCGSPWICPVCASKIGARRAEEIAAGASAWRARGGHLYMLTLTLRHNADRQLKGLNDNMIAAYRRLKQGNMWTLAKKRFGIVGYVTGKEHTTGKKGWHPHIHAVIFTVDDLRERLTDLEQWLARRWQAVLQELGEDADIEHGTDVRPADDNAAKYIAKLQNAWGVGGELAGKDAKKARGGNKTPVQLLAAARAGNKRAGELYQEYAAATAGDSWLRWSPGLRQLCGLADEQSDEQVAAEQTEDAAPLLVLKLWQWRGVCRRGLRGWLLSHACRGDGALLARLLALNGLEIEQSQLEHKYEGERL